MDDNATLKVRKGAQIFGPMTLIQLAELLAAGRVAETDDVSPDGRNWQPILAYFEQQLAAQSPPPVEESAPVTAEVEDDDDFLPSFSETDSSSEPAYTLLEEDVDEPQAADDEADEEDEPILPVKPRAKRKRPKPARQVELDDEPEDDEESPNIDDILRQLLEHEQEAPAINEPRPVGDAGAAAPIPTTPAPPMKMTAVERRKGFVLLFNGKNFSGWRFRENSALPENLPDNWKVKRGCIQLTGGGKPALMSQWDYRDFDLRFVWRASFGEQYNSGLCLRSGRKIGRNQICLQQGKEGMFLGGEIEGAENAENLQNLPGQWNEWRVLAEGDTLTLWCNGKQAWEATGFEPEEGYIGFLAAGTQFEFANLRIKELGVEYLNDLEEQWMPTDENNNRWKQMGDSLVAEKGKSAPIETVFRDYQDYLLRLDWKLTKSATGTLYLRGADCAEAAVRLGGADEGSGGLPAIHIPPDEKLDNPAGQWNFMEVEVVNNVIAVRLNGDEVISKAKLPRGGTTQSSGPIGLSHNGRPVQFRNIRIRPLDDGGRKSKWLSGSPFGRKSE